MTINCPRCGTPNAAGEASSATAPRCIKCGAFLPRSKAKTGDTSEAVGLVGGAALGAAIAGPVGALVGAVLGAMVGRESKGLG